MKSLLSLVLVLVAGSVTAGEACNLQLDAGLRISPGALEFYNQDKEAYQIKDHRYLVVDGKQLTLDNAQQALVAKYDQQVRALVPEVRGMALEGIDLAIVGVTTAFDGLLGERNNISNQLRGELNHLKGDVRRYFDKEIISLNRQQEDAPELFGQYFETRMERIVETSVQDSIGDIMLAMAKEVIASGGDMEAFGARMERFGQEMEEQMRAKATELEARGASLCRAAATVNALEDQLRNVVPDIRALDLIRLNTEAPRKGSVEI